VKVMVARELGGHDEEYLELESAGTCEEQDYQP
jgi:hypothetical protein